MLSREEFNLKQSALLEKGVVMQELHDERVSKYKDNLQAQSVKYLSTLDHILSDIAQLESDPTHQCIADINKARRQVDQQQAALDYVIKCLNIENLLELVQAQSTDLSTVGMALDALEQLMMICADDIGQCGRMKKRLEVVIERIEGQLSTDFESWMTEVMSRVRWPVVPQGEDLELLLLTCQSFRLFELITLGSDKSGSKMIEMLTSSMAAQFHFHFSLDKPTNRLDKPEWALDYMMSVIEEHYDFITELDQLIPSNLPELFIRSLINTIKERFMVQKSAIMDSLLLPVVVESVVSFSEQLCGDKYQYLTACQELLSIFLQSDKEIEDWIVMEKSRILDAYDDAFNSLPVSCQYSNIEPIVDFLQGHFNYLRSLSVPQFQSLLLVKVTIPCLERVLQKIEFDIPAFLSKPSDVQQCAEIHNCCSALKSMIGVEWGEDLAMITLANTDHCKSLFTFDPSLKVGTVFWRAVDELVSIESQCRERIYGYLRDSSVSLLTRWSSAMHYSKLTFDDLNNNNLPDSLRQALVDIPSRCSIIRDHLRPESLFLEMFTRFAHDLTEIVFSKLIIRNYFTKAGAAAFAHHLKVIDSVLLKVAVLPEQDTMQGGKLADCVLLLTLPEEEGGTRSAMVLKRLLQNDKLQEATRVLKTIGVCRLTLAECEQVLASRRH